MSFINKGVVSLTQHALIGLKGYYVKLSNEDFDLLKIARTHLFEALSIEERFNLVLENYAEFEQELFNCSINSMLFDVDDWQSSVGEIHVVNRRIVNLLTTCRLYTDHICHNICSMYGHGSAQEEIVKKEQSQEYDSDCPGYRVMNALRNHVQHFGLPISVLNKNRHPVGKESNVFTKHTIQLRIDINTLSENAKFKKKVLAELQELGESVEFTPLLRQCLGSIGKIHSKIRELLSSDLLAWDEQIQHHISKYQESTGYVAGLKVITVSESQTTENFSVFEDPIKRRQMLENKNKYLTHYSFNFISSESPQIHIE